MWSYRELKNAIELEAHEYGMKTYKAIEYNTSMICTYHNNEAACIPRGMIKCSTEKSNLNADPESRKAAFIFFVS